MNRDLERCVLGYAGDKSSEDRQLADIGCMGIEEIGAQYWRVIFEVRRVKIPGNKALGFELLDRGP